MSATNPDQTALPSLSTLVGDGHEANKHQREHNMCAAAVKSPPFNKKTNRGNRVKSLRMSNRREGGAEEEEIAVVFYR